MLIGTFSRHVGLSEDTLRYYEKIGLMPDVDRTRSGRRSYSDDHLAWVDFLKVLKATGMGINDMVQYVRLRSLGIASIKERQDLLRSHLKVVEAKRSELERAEILLNEKITLFQSVLDGEVDGDSLECASGDRQT